MHRYLESGKTLAVIMEQIGDAFILKHMHQFTLVFGLYMLVNVFSSLSELVTNRHSANGDDCCAQAMD